MPSYSAILSTERRSVAFVAFEGMKFLDLAGPLQVFSDARRPSGEPAYQVTVLSEAGGPIGTDTVCQIGTTAFVAVVGRTWDTVLVCGGSAAYQAMNCENIRSFLATASDGCRRLGSICLGAHILAAGGHLSRRRATTHWEGCGELRDRFPDVTVADDAIFVEDRGIWTSAGVTAGIDMAIEMVRRDFGASEAMRIARLFVLPMHRSGGQRQYSTPLATQTADKRTCFDELILSLVSDLQGNHSVSSMAQRVRMSERNFSRRFTSELGVSPARYLEQLRVDHAAALLHRWDMSLTTAQIDAGFSSGEHMRRAFHRCLGVSPSTYAAKFASKSEQGRKATSKDQDKTAS